MSEGASYVLDRGFLAFEGEEWWLYSLGEGPADSDITKLLTPLRMLDLQEVANVGRLAQVAQVVDNDCAFEKFYTETDLLSATLQGLLEQRRTQNVLDAGDAIHRQFGIWLSAFRACDDHTSRLLSDAFGRTSSIFKDFDDLKREACDANFAYWLCSGLRNAREHAGNVLNDLRVDITRDSGGQLQTNLVAELAPGPTAQRFPKLSAALRAVLRECPRNLQVITMVRAVKLSVHWLRCSLLVRINADHEELLQQCWDLQQEAWAVQGGRWAVFTDQPPEKMPAARFRMRHNPFQQAELITRMYESCQLVATSPPLSMEASDLILDESEARPTLPI